MRRFLLCTLLVSIGCLSHAESSDRKDDKRTISVQGQGKLNAVPDIATLTAEVRQEGPQLDTVSAHVRQGIGRVLDALKAQSIADKDVQTVAYEVQPRYERDKQGNMKPNGYVVLNRVQAKIRDLKKVGKTLSALVDAGATSINGPDFDFDDPQALEQKALSLAMADARAKAAVLAEAAGAKLGVVQTISQEGGIAWPMRKPMMSRAFGMGVAAASAPEPIAAGEQAFTSNVQVTFLLQ